MLTSPGYTCSGPSSGSRSPSNFIKAPSPQHTPLVASDVKSSFRWAPNHLSKADLCGRLHSHSQGFLPGPAEDRVSHNSPHFHTSILPIPFPSPTPKPCQTRVQEHFPKVPSCKNIQEYFNSHPLHLSQGIQSCPLPTASGHFPIPLLLPGNPFSSCFQQYSQSPPGKGGIGSPPCTD